MKLTVDVKLIRDTYLQIYNTRITTLDSCYLGHSLYSYFFTEYPNILTIVTIYIYYPTLGTIT